jgi:gamma-glutamyltranspeptidase/glutathione hydrolase
MISSIAQMISNVVDFDMDIGSATAAPRLQHQHVPDVLYYERNGLAPDVEAALRALGHNVETLPGYLGDIQSMLVLPDGTLTGVTDPRKGGAAVTVRQAREVV